MFTVKIQRDDEWSLLTSKDCRVIYRGHFEFERYLGKDAPSEICALLCTDEDITHTIFRGENVYVENMYGKTVLVL